MNAKLTWAGVVLGLIALFGFAYPQRERVLKGQNDFASFYVGAQLAGETSAGDALYSRDVNIERIQEVLGFPMVGTTFVRPPFYAAVLRPFAFLEYRIAYTAFLAMLVASILWFIVRFTRECPELPVYAAFGLPLLMPVCNGQDTPFLLAAIGAFVLLMRSGETRGGRDFLAGVLLSFCAIKFHLFLYVALLLFAKRKWRVIGGGATGLAGLNVLGLLVVGPGAYVGWMRTMLDPWISPGPESLPNLHGLALTLGGGAPVEATLVVIAVVLFLTVLLTSRSFEVTLAAALVTGLLTSFHSGPSDDILLFAVFVLVLRSSRDPALRVASAFTVMPVPYLLLLAGSPYSAAIPVMLLAWLGLAVWAGVKENRGVVALVS